MAFHFALHVVLHFRESLEHQQELRLRAANQRVAQVRHLIEQMDARRGELSSTQSRELSAGITAAELRFELQCDAELMRHRGELERQLVVLQQACEQQRKIFQEARRARETLESVRDQQLRLYQKESARREQRTLDDLFLMRRQYISRG
jgi:flagellar export protein FliJ